MGSGNKIYRGVLTGCNDAFVIDEQKRQQLLEEDPNSADLIRPLAIGDDVRRWNLRDKKRYLIVTRIGVDIQRYPAIFAHLSQYEERLRARTDQGNHWWELRSCDYYDVFDKPKIIYPEISMESRFAFDNSGRYTNNKAFIIPVDDKYLLGILGSRLVWNLLTNICTSVQGGALELKSIYMSKIPIPKPSLEERARIEYLVEICISGNENQVKGVEGLIEESVRNLYGL